MHAHDDRAVRPHVSTAEVRRGRPRHPWLLPHRRGGAERVLPVGLSAPAMDRRDCGRSRCVERDGRCRMGTRTRRGMGHVDAVPVLDSDVLIDYLRDAGPGRDLVRRMGATGVFRVTAITAFELGLGRDYARDPTPANELLAAPCLALTREEGLR